MEQVHTRLEQWCSTVWHELHAPLMALVNPLDELARDPACIDIHSRLALIQRNARRLLQLVDSLLLPAKPQRGCSPDEQQVESEPISNPITTTEFSDAGHAALLILEGHDAELSESSHKEPHKLVQQEWSVAGGEPAALASSGSPNEGDRAFLAKLNTLMYAELENPAFDVPMICARMHFSAKQMQRKVRMLTGLTPTEYLRQKRLRRAEEMLLQGKSVSRAAYAAGFLSQSYFTTCFKTWAGETPRAWQKRMLRESAMVTHELLER